MRPPRDTKVRSGGADRHDRRVAHKTAEFADHDNLADDRNRTAVVFWLTIPMAASSAIRPEMVDLVSPESQSCC